jgi:restriction endonuclease Mrr
MWDALTDCVGGIAPYKSDMPLVHAKGTIKPILEVLSDGTIHRDHDIQEAVAQKLGLTPEERALLHKNGTPVYKNRTAFGLVYIQDVRYLPDTAAWGRRMSTGTTETYMITDAGLKALREGLADNL